MTQNWAHHQRNDKFCSQRPEEQDTISTVQDLLDQSITPESAAHAIATIYEPRLLRGEKISFYPFSLLSRVIIHPATTSQDHQHIVEVLLHLSKLPDVIVDSKPFKENRRTYWRDIPEFSFWFLETGLRTCPASPHWHTFARETDTDLSYVHAIHNIDLGNCPLSWQQQAQQYKAANSFAALYLTVLTPSITYEWKSMQCIARDALIQALEVEISTYAHIRRAGIYIPAAAQWLLHSAAPIWDFCKRKDLNSGNVEWREWIGSSDGSNALWKGEDGFIVERWTFWKQRFAYAAGVKRGGLAGRVVDDVVACARKACKAMHAIEQEDAFALDAIREALET